MQIATFPTVFPDDVVNAELTRIETEKLCLPFNRSLDWLLSDITAHPGSQTAQTPDDSQSDEPADEGDRWDGLG